MEINCDKSMFTSKHKWSNKLQGKFFLLIKPDVSWVRD